LGRRRTFPLPFDHISFTKQEVRDGIHKLQNAKLIRPVLYINDDERYSLVNNEFRQLLDSLYIIHIEIMGLIQHRRMYERSTKEEYKQIELIYGKKKAHKIFLYSYEIRQGNGKEIKEGPYSYTC
jgi:hypothetical protein